MTCVVLVCGGRDYNDWHTLCAALDHLDRERGITRIVHGAYRGADTLADQWARSRKIKPVPYPANWRTEGPAAGPNRNQRMLDNEHPDLVVAFPGGSGTADMTERAHAAGVKVIEIKDRGRRA